MADVLFAPWRYEYLVSEKPVGCIFCEAAASGDDDASLVVYRGRRVFAMLNRFPYTNGHVMVAPVAHEAWFSDSSAETLAELIAIVARAQAILVAEYRTDGLNVGVELRTRRRARASPTITTSTSVPRWAGDTNFMTVAGDVRVVPEELSVTRRRLAALFAGGA